MTSTSGRLLRSARERSRLSQTDVARRSGVAQSVISAYESGRREPGMQTLSRLVEATGHQLVLDVVPTPGRALGLPDTPLGRRLRRRRKAVIETAEKRRAHNVRVFGSVARGEDTSESDVDLLVDFLPGASLTDQFRLQEELTIFLQTSVDVISRRALKPRDTVIREAALAL